MNQNSKSGNHDRMKHRAKLVDEAASVEPSTLPAGEVPADEADDNAGMTTMRVGEDEARASKDEWVRASVEDLKRELTTALIGLRHRLDEGNTRVAAIEAALDSAAALLNRNVDRPTTAAELRDWLTAAAALRDLPDTRGLSDTRGLPDTIDRP